MVVELCEKSCEFWIVNLQNYEKKVRIIKEYSSKIMWKKSYIEENKLIK